MTDLAPSRRTAAEHELQLILARAQALADTLDPTRTFTHSDEVTRTIVRSCDAISRAATQALSMLKVTA